MKILVWNTGRTYTSHGQRIAATSIGHKQTAFVDIDRGISYIVPCECERQTVMAAYDHNIGTEHLPFGEVRHALYKAATEHVNDDGEESFAKWVEVP